MMLKDGVLFLVLLCIVPTVFLVQTNLYRKDDGFVNIMCPVANLNFGFHKKSSNCAAMCSKSATCKSFFFSKQFLVCKGAEGVLSDTLGCYSSTNTAYYISTEVTTSTSTTSTTSSTTTTTSSTTTTPSSPTTSTTLSTISSAFIGSQFGHSCGGDNDCTMSNFMCLQWVCSCALGYSYESASGLCVSHCTSYGVTYIEYTGYAFSNSDVSDIAFISLSQCESDCTNSPTVCIGFSYSQEHFACKLNIDSTTSSYEIYEHPDIKYYARNCA